MDEKSTIALNPTQQLLDFMLEMPEIYGYEQDHLTHAERLMWPQSDHLRSEEPVK